MSTQAEEIALALSGALDDLVYLDAVVFLTNACPVPLYGYYLFRNAPGRVVVGRYGAKFELPQSAVRPYRLWSLRHKKVLFCRSGEVKEGYVLGEGEDGFLQVCTLPEQERVDTHRNQLINPRCVGPLMLPVWGVGNR